MSRIGRKILPLPKGVTDAPRFGLFTFTILSKLAENPNVTYRQLGQAVLQQYSADSRTRPTPLFEGELDARVFGTDNVYVAGASVFPTGGMANPTLTLIALSLRLAEHLAATA